ncbi:MAG: SCO family protein [Bacteroidota bacterium]|nr:SCO family protein [Bacteroidota bacterium]
MGMIWFAVSCKQKVNPETAAAATLPFYNTADFTPVWIAKTSPAYDSVHTIPAFRFTNQYGETITEKDYQGKIYVADFFFTSCPGICKQLTTHLGLVQKAFQDDNRVMLLSHSVTPDLDSVKVLQKYALAYGVQKGKWNLVTGNRDQLYTLARRSYFADEDLGEKKSAADFLHTENLLLIDTHRRIRGVYKGTSLKDVNDLISDIALLEKEN